MQPVSAPATFVPSAAASAATPAGLFTPPSVGEAVKGFFDKFRVKDEVGIVARLDAQADLSVLDGIPRGPERRAAAWDAIQKTAAETQPAMRTLLDDLKQSGKVSDFQAWQLGNTFEITVPRSAWQETYDAINATGSTSLMMAFDGTGLLRYENEDTAKSAAAAVAMVGTKQLASGPSNPFKPAPRDPKYDAGPTDSETFDFSPEGVAWNATQIGADKAWADGITGKGIRVGVMDTGVDRKHPMLRHAVGDAKDAASWYGKTASRDAMGHGTHVAGTIAGRDPKGLRHPGIAPDAQLMVAPMDQSLIGPFQWFLAPGEQGAVGDARKGADIINNSWGIEGKLAPVADMLDVPLKQLREAGTLVVFAAGNSGPSDGTINFPGANPDVFTVGATRRDGYVADFSSRAKEGQAKPDISAPGAAVPSTVPVSNVGSMLPSARLTNIITGDAIALQAEQKPVKGTGGAMWQMSGTSMASPTTAGAAALVLQANPTLLPEQLEQVLTSTAVDMGPEGFDGAYGAGRLDVTAAIAAAKQSGEQP